MIPKDKDIGFVTDRPLEWFQAMKKYSIERTIQSRCVTKERKNGRMSIVKIHWAFQKTKEVHASLNFVTGIFSVKGRLKSDWVKTEFPIIQEQMNSTVQTAALAEEIISEEDKSKMENKSTDDSASEISNVWTSIEMMRNASETLKRSVTTISPRVEQLAINMEDIVLSTDSKIKEGEEKLKGMVELSEELQEKSFVKRQLGQAFK